MSWALTLGRSSFAIALGVLIGASAALIGVHTAVRGDRVVVETIVATVPGAGPQVAIVDASRSALDMVGTPDAIVALLGLRPGERVLSIAGVPAGVGALGPAWLAAAPGDFLDIEVASSDPARGAVRRVLVLVHP